MEAGGGDSGEWRLLFGLEGVGRRARYQVSGLFDSLAQPRDASATYQEELISCLAFSVHWHSRETRQPPYREELYQLRGFFSSVAQPRDASATWEARFLQKPE